MSYTDGSGYPIDMTFEIIDNELIIFFHCPRCGAMNQHKVNPNDFITDMAFECHHPSCVREGERYGYRLTFYPNWNESILGRLDRPLHGDAKEKPTQKAIEYWGGRLPSKVKMKMTVHSDLSWLIKRASGIFAVKDEVYTVTVNPYGAVTAILPNGEKLGLKPAEFDVVEWIEE